LLLFEGNAIRSRLCKDSIFHSYKLVSTYVLVVCLRWCVLMSIFWESRRIPLIWWKA